MLDTGRSLLVLDCGRYLPVLVEQMLGMGESVWVVAEEILGCEISVWILNCCGSLRVLALEKLDSDGYLEAEGLQIFSGVPEQGKYWGDSVASPSG